MTSVVDKYYKRIIQNIDNVRMKFDISALLVKSKEFDSKIENIENDNINFDTKIKKLDKNIILFNNNLTNHIDQYKKDVPDDLNSKINGITTIKSDITSLNTYIDNLPNDIDSKIDDITNIKSDITSIKSDLNSVDVNKVNLNYNISQLNKKKSDNNLSFININIEKIRNINNSQKYTISNIFIEYLKFEKELLFNSDVKNLLVHEFTIEDDFIKSSIIKIHETMIYHYSLKNSYYILLKKYQLFDENDNLLKEFFFNVISKGNVLRNMIIFQNSSYYKLEKDINSLKIKLFLERVDLDNTVNLNVKLMNLSQKNTISIEYLKVNNI